LTITAFNYYHYLKLYYLPIINLEKQEALEQKKTSKTNNFVIKHTCLQNLEHETETEWDHF
jgi:hypothetical protein